MQQEKNLCRSKMLHYCGASQPQQANCRRDASLTQRLPNVSAESSALAIRHNLRKSVQAAQLHGKNFPISSLSTASSLTNPPQNFDDFDLCFSLPEFVIPQEQAMQPTVDSAVRSLNVKKHLASSKYAGLRSGQVQPIFLPQTDASKKGHNQKTNSQAFLGRKNLLIRPNGPSAIENSRPRDVSAKQDAAVLHKKLPPLTPIKATKATPTNDTSKLGSLLKGWLLEAKDHERRRKPTTTDEPPTDEPPTNGKITCHKEKGRSLDSWQKSLSSEAEVCSVVEQPSVKVLQHSHFFATGHLSSANLKHVDLPRNAVTRTTSTESTYPNNSGIYAIQKHKESFQTDNDCDVENTRAATRDCSPHSLHVDSMDKKSKSYQEPSHTFSNNPRHISSQDRQGIAVNTASPKNNLCEIRPALECAGPTVVETVSLEAPASELPASTDSVLFQLDASNACSTHSVLNCADAAFVPMESPTLQCREIHFLSLSSGVNVSDNLQRLPDVIRCALAVLNDSPGSPSEALKSGVLPSFLLKDERNAQRVFASTATLSRLPLEIADSTRLDNMRTYLSRNLFLWRSCLERMRQLWMKWDRSKTLLELITAKTARLSSSAFALVVPDLLEGCDALRLILEKYLLLEEELQELFESMEHVYSLAVQELEDLREQLLLQAREVETVEGRAAIAALLRLRQQLQDGDKMPEVLWRGRWLAQSARRYEKTAKTFGDGPQQNEDCNLLKEKACRLLNGDIDQMCIDNGAAKNQVNFTVLTDNDEKKPFSIEGQQRSRRGQIIAKNNVFVFHVPPFMRKRDLRDLFEIYGPLTSLHFPKDVSTRWGHRGLAFVCFEHHADALQAIFDLNGREIEVGRRLKVEFKRPATPSSFNDSIEAGSRVGADRVATGKLNLAENTTHDTQQTEAGLPIPNAILRLANTLRVPLSAPSVTPQVPSSGVPMTKDLLNATASLLEYQDSIMKRHRFLLSCRNISEVLRIIAVQQSLL